MTRATAPANPSATTVWLLLLGLTLITYGGGRSGVQGTALVLPALAIAVVKAQLVVDHFMELRGVRLFWRLLLGAYLLLIGLALGTAFLLAH